MTMTSLGLPAIRRDAGDPAAEMPRSGPLIDTFGRVATDLRVSLTDRCNLRCTYCMPAEGMDWLPGDELLTHDELTRLLTLAVTRLGIDSVRFTGGEPLLYRRLEDLVAEVTALRPRPEIALTTNGLGLARRAQALADAGVDRVNVSLDSLDAAHFAAITRRDRLNDVLDGLSAATAAGLGPVKVNAVLDPVTGLSDAVELLDYCLRYGYQLRIIEQMPLDAEHLWRRDATLGADDIVTALAAHFELRTDPAPRGSAPAQLWRVNGGPATVGIIASVSHAFCAACDRTRLTADGQIRNCLFAADETDLRGLLRGGADDDALELVWRAAMWRKAAGHGINDPGFVQPQRSMSAIGG
ncbi:GTP 3',8-cyclase MoaA [Mycolicibacterium sarraceniae]|uniref:GTP 3',8-cyclase n=1 Tax=Mycolicibacterium sarraceniae TaxID=1534348 RepID=A0A7I7SLW6_9MYCO|nr:GTP 3',8-cyclase MoaA [Mycolicibacterium sarraceniae]BBY57743.1 GTP 3',8-cyclase [Mycolicibacterium sarraceniae]